MADGFQALGELLAGGSQLRGDAAFLEGLEQGTTIKLRRSQTENALAQARLRQQEAEAKEQLGEVVEALELDPRLTPALTSGVSDLSDLTTGIGNLQEQGFRGTIADVALPFEQRQAAAQAVQGQVVDPIQFGPGGELFTDVFSPEVVVSPTGTAAIAADEALARQRDASAALSDERRQNPDRFKSSTTINVGGQPLGDAILDDIGESTIPADIVPEEATGILGAGRSIANTAFDVVNANLPFPDADRAQNALTDLMTRTQVVGQQGVPGRPSNYLMQQLAVFGVTPNDPFRGDQRSLSRMSQTSSFLAGEIDRLRRILNGGRLTPTKVAQHEDALRNLAALKQDYDVVISRFNAPDDAEGQETTDAGTSDLNAVGVGQTVTVNGVTITRTE